MFTEKQIELSCVLICTLLNVEYWEQREWDLGKRSRCLFVFFLFPFLQIHFKSTKMLTKFYISVVFSLSM